MMKVMKVYVAVRFKGKENQSEIEQLCGAVKAAGMKDFCFVRDVEHYKHTFDDPKELWQRVYDELGACDALLVDASDNPKGGRMVEAGIAYALRKKIFVVVRRGVQYKGLFDGIASTVIEYDTPKDITNELKKYDQESSFNFTDKATLLVMLLFLGVIIFAGTMQISIPLAVAGTMMYWFIVRRLFKSMRAFDRVVIFIPLAGLWLAGYVALLPFGNYVAWGWALGYWIAALLVLQRLKFSL